MERKAEGYFKNGDEWDGGIMEEDGETWYSAANGNYETREVPTRYPLFTLTRFADGTPESYVHDYQYRHSTRIS